MWHHKCCISVVTVGDIASSESLFLCSAICQKRTLCKYGRIYLRWRSLYCKTYIAFGLFHYKVFRRSRTYCVLLRLMMHLTVQRQSEKKNEEIKFHEIADDCRIWTINQTDTRRLLSVSYKSIRFVVKKASFHLFLKIVLYLPTH